MVKCTGRGLVVKRPGVLSKVLMLNLVLGVGVFSLLPSFETPNPHIQRQKNMKSKGRQLSIFPCFFLSYFGHILSDVGSYFCLVFSAILAIFCQKYEEKRPTTVDFPLFFQQFWPYSVRCLFIFLPCMWGVGVPGHISLDIFEIL